MHGPSVKTESGKDDIWGYILIKWWIGYRHHISVTEMAMERTCMKNGQKLNIARHGALMENRIYENKNKKWNGRI